MSSVLKIEDDLIYTKIFSFCTLVTRLDEYMEMVESAQGAGFDGEDVEFLYFDNREINKYDGYSAINRAIKEAKGKYLIFWLLYRDWETDRKSTRLNSSHSGESRMPSSA